MKGILEQLSEVPEKTMDKWLAIGREGLRTKRMHVVPTLREHTVGEHTASALIYVVYLARRNPSVRLENCMLHTLQHDLAEQYTGDMPANAKQENPMLHSALVGVETTWEKSNLLPNGLRKNEIDLCKMADWLQLQDYCVQERRMGNREVTVVYENVTRYIFEHPAFRQIKGATRCYNMNVTRWNDACQ